MSERSLTRFPAAAWKPSNDLAQNDFAEQIYRWVKFSRFNGFWGFFATFKQAAKNRVAFRECLFAADQQPDDHCCEQHQADDRVCPVACLYELH